MNEPHEGRDWIDEEFAEAQHKVRLVPQRDRRTRLYLVTVSAMVSEEAILGVKADTVEVSLNGDLLLFLDGALALLVASGNWTSVLPGDDEELEAR